MTQEAWTPLLQVPLGMVVAKGARFDIFGLDAVPFVVMHAALHYWPDRSPPRAMTELIFAGRESSSNDLFWILKFRDKPVVRVTLPIAAKESVAFA